MAFFAAEFSQQKEVENHRRAKQSEKDATKKGNRKKNVMQNRGFICSLLTLYLHNSSQAKRRRNRSLHMMTPPASQMTKGKQSRQPRLKNLSVINTFPIDSELLTPVFRVIPTKL
jgi:hypothetical protein